MIFLKSKEEIEKIRAACSVVVEVLERLKEEVKPGVSTWDLDKIAEEITLNKGAKPAFKGYRGYPASVCFAVNEEVVHGIPSRKRVLDEGDIVGLDFGVCLEGFYGDSAITVPVGEISPLAERLLNVTKGSLYKGIEMAYPSNRLFDISRAIEKYVEAQGFSVVKAFVGHGIGRNLHEDPQVPNFVPENGNWGKGIRLKTGMVIAIEPMVNIGASDVRVLGDGWTAVTLDGNLSAHFEHTVAITESGPVILTEFTN
ncbi:MAG TPA: type I methionyl aminopeptidase [Thermodesulfobacteriota bacterium]|nr:type I methionyl aminopeptidase [Thermodesulfobacteriota bacterium]